MNEFWFFFVSSRIGIVYCIVFHQHQILQSFFLYHSAVLLIFNHRLSAHPYTF